MISTSTWKTRAKIKVATRNGVVKTPLYGVLIHHDYECFECKVVSRGIEALGNRDIMVWCYRSKLNPDDVKLGLTLGDMLTRDIAEACGFGKVIDRLNGQLFTPRRLSGAIYALHFVGSPDPALPLPS